jgi:uncharacterized protein
MREFLNKRKTQQIIVFLLLGGLLFLLSFLLTGSVLLSSETKNLWLYSGLFMVLFSMFFIEPHYSAPTNVISNTTALILVLISIKPDFVKEDDLTLWYTGLVYLLTIGFTSFVAMVARDTQQSPDSKTNKIAEGLKFISVRFGSGRILYSAAFLYFIITYFSIRTWQGLLLFIFWWFILITEPQKFYRQFGNVLSSNIQAVGEIFAVQSRRMFLIKLFDDGPSLSRFDAVEFRYLKGEDKDYINSGFVFNTYYLNQEKWAKVLWVQGEAANKTKLMPNVVCKKEPSKEIADMTSRFVGIVSEGSNISKINFEYSQKKENVQEGDLLEVESEGKRIFYQITNGTTTREVLEAKNETGYVVGEAVQVGIWNEENGYFEKYGWVPPMTSLVLRADTKNFSKLKAVSPLFELGVIPSTDLSAVINLHDVVSHHTAILGVTGSGKSFLAREIIREIKKDVKVICIDFTGEYINELKILKPSSIVDPTKVPDIESLIARRETETRSKNSAEVLKIKKQLQDKLGEHTSEFMKSKNNLAIFELPDLSNTSFILEFTQQFLDAVFQYAKNNKGNKICIVLEEAHTIIPEKDSLGDLGDFGSNKAVVSKIGQIGLQGRKYGVGFLVIAQRTANVSKTVLTQCNTVICFQAFDETSFNFLGNYIGKNLVQALPNLRPHHAIVAGKALKSTAPIIVDLTKGPK